MSRETITNPTGEGMKEIIKRAMMSDDAEGVLRCELLIEQIAEQKARTLEARARAAVQFDSLAGAVGTERAWRMVEQVAGGEMPEPPEVDEERTDDG